MLSLARPIECPELALFWCVVFDVLRFRLEQQTEGIPVQGLAWGNQSREMDNIKAQFVAVNGIRKVACVVRLDNDFRKIVYTENVSD